MGTDELIKCICEKCPYWKKICWFDYGDSMTKIPCWALVKLYEIYTLKLEPINEILKGQKK